MHARYSSAISHWLETILFERFGHRFAISQDRGFIHLAMAGSPVTIRIVSDPTTFTQASSDLPCSRWEGAAEGWHLPLAQSLPTPGMDRLPVPLTAAEE